MNTIVDQVFNNYMRQQTSKQQINPNKDDNHLKIDASQKQLFDSSNKENFLKKRILTIQEPSNENTKQSKDNIIVDVFNKTFGSPLEKRKLRSTTYHKQQSQNAQIFRANLQLKNDFGQNNLQTINAVQDQYFQFQPRMSLVKSQKTLFEQQNSNNSSSLRNQNSNKNILVKKCDTERSINKINSINNTFDGIEQQQQLVVQNNYQNEQIKQQNYNNKEDNIQKQQILLEIQNKDNQLIQSKFILKRSYKDLQKNICSSQKNLFSKFFDSTRNKVQNQQNPKTTISERQSLKEISQLSQNDIDKQLKQNKHPTQNELDTSQIRNLSEDRISLNRQKNILIKKRSILKPESNETSMNIIRDDMQNGTLQKIPSSNKLINDNKQNLNPILVKNYSQDELCFEKMNNNLSGVLSPKLQSNTIFNDNSSSSSIPTKLRSITNHNQLNSPHNPISQRMLTQKRMYSEEHKFKTSISMFQVEMDDFSFIKDLGTGSYAVVRYAIHKKTNFQVAIKSYDKKKLQDPQKKQNVEREIKILQGLNHKHIIKLYKVIECQENLNLVMEYCSSFPLNLYLKTKQSKRLHELEAKFIFRQLVEAVMYLHKKEVIHRDIKLENILINQDKIIKLIDFGFSVVVSPQCKLTMFCGTPFYMAPEIISKKGYTFGVDVWALGILLHKLLTGSFPFAGKDNKQLYRNIIKCEIDYPMYLSLSAKNLLQSILIEDPNKRKSLEEILKDEWF